MPLISSSSPPTRSNRASFGSKQGSSVKTLNSTIRPASEVDIPRITAIFGHYAEHTALTFNTKARPEQGFLDILEACNSNRLPFLVAVSTIHRDSFGSDLARVGSGGSTGVNDSAVLSDSDSASLAPEEGQQVLGFAYVSPFRETKEAYAHTAELSIFLAPESLGGRWNQGVGSKLLHQAIESLEVDGANVIRQLVGMVAIEKDRDAADRLRRWYEKRGFETVGTLKKVGWKLGDWIDVRMVQKEIVPVRGGLDKVEEAVGEGSAMNLPYGQTPRRRSSSGTHKRWGYSIR